MIIIEYLCAPGHKGLYAPMGVGFIALRDNVEIGTIIEGGTGSNSMKLAQPDNMPERLESGTLNNVGIIGLCAGIDFVVGKSVSSIYKHEKNLEIYLQKNLRKIIMLRYILQALMMLFLRRYCRLTIKIIRQGKNSLLYWL